MSGKIAIFGGGGLGREILQIIKELNELSYQWDFIGFFDDRELMQDDYLGNINVAANWPEPLAVVIAMADTNSRASVVKNLRENSKLNFPNIIHPGAHCSPSENSLGEGNVVCNQCHFTTGIAIQDFNFFNVRTTVGHDGRIGSFNVFNTNAVISGNVSIGDGNFFGMNASVIQGKKIGSNALIGASSLVLSNVNDNERVFGNPAYRM